jgi:hypothetical protein
MNDNLTTNASNEAESPAFLVGAVISSLISELNQKKEKCLIHVVKELLGKPINKTTGKRISCLKFEGQMHYERYVWDYGKKSEKFLMEWDLIFPPLDINNVNYIPTIEVNAPVSVKGCL